MCMSFQVNACGRAYRSRHMGICIFVGRCAPSCISFECIYIYLCPEDLGFESPSGRDIFCFKNFDTFTRTSALVSKMNAVARAQLTFQMLTLLHIYIYILIFNYAAFYMTWTLMSIQSIYLDKKYVFYHGEWLSYILNQRFCAGRVI